MTRHSSIVGGSTADRLLNCPGSYQAALALPKSADTSSVYAAEGTFYHSVMEIIMAVRQRDNKHGKFDAHKYAMLLLGHRFYDRELTREHVETVISPALTMLDDIESAYGGGFKVLEIEKRVAFPGIPGAFGTIDLIMVNETCMLHLDWKFGQGVGVGVIYTDELGERVNAQLMYYLAGAMTTMPAKYKNKKSLVLAIVQPRNPPARPHATVSRQEVSWFVEDMHNAVVKALDREPVRQKGEHCRFAPCKIDCPLWTGPVLDLTVLGAPASPKTIPDDAYGAYLAKAKVLADIAAQFKKEVDEQLHAYLENGGTVPGWRLKLKTKMRRWIDEDTVEQALHELGFEMDEIWQSKLQTFQSVDATAKRLGVKIPDELRIAPETHETTIATTDDPAPVVERQLAIEQFRASLKALRG